MTKRLTEQDLVRDEVSGNDKREKIVSLTEAGWDTVQMTDTFVNRQVGETLDKLDAGNGEGETALKGIEKYANTLKENRLGTVLDLEEKLEEGSEKDVEIVKGYRPGILGRCLEMHMEYYSPTVCPNPFCSRTRADTVGVNRWGLERNLKHN